MTRLALLLILLTGAGCVLPDQADIYPDDDDSAISDDDDSGTDQ